MPKFLERKLATRANKMGLSGERKNAYVYGTLRKTGWTPSTQKAGKKKSPKSINLSYLRK